MTRPFCFRVLLLLSVISLLLCMPFCPGLALSGVVQDMEGEPIAGATVRIIMEMMPPADCHGKVSTDSAGRFSFTREKKSDDGQYLLYVFADGYCFESTRIPFTQEENVVLTLSPEYVVKGRVVDEAGAPVSGATVEMAALGASRIDGRSLGFGGSFPDRFLIRATSGNDGSFELKQMPGPEWRVLFVVLRTVKSGHARTEAEFKDIQKTITIALPHECTLNGTVLLPDESAAPQGTPLTLSVQGPKGPEYISIYVDRVGRFSRSGLRPGQYVVSLGQNYWYSQTPWGQAVAHPQLKWAMAPKVVDLKYPGTADATFVMSRGAVVEGRAVDRVTLEPISGAVVFARPERSPDIALRTGSVTGVVGEFSLRVPAGKVVLAMQMPPRTKTSVASPAEEMPLVSLVVRDGETRSDVLLRISGSDSVRQLNDDGQMASVKPATEDLQLKPGTYGLRWDSEVVLTDGSAPPARITAELRARVRRMPRLVSKTPVFAALRFDGAGDNGILVAALDESKGTGTGWDTAYLDVNRNWDLSDDRPVTWKASGERRYATSTWAVAQARVGLLGQKPTYKSMAVALDVHWAGGLYLCLIRKGAWRCQVDSNKGPLDCILADMNRNGIWGDPEIGQLNTGSTERLYSIHWRFEATGDFLFIDNNGYGSTLTGWASPHGIRLHSWTRVNGRYYAVRVSRTEKALTILPAQPSLSKLSVYSTDFGGKPGRSGRIMLRGEQGVYEIETKGEPVELPEGKWQIDDVWLDITSAVTPDLQFGCELGKVVSLRPGQQVNADVSGTLRLYFDHIRGRSGQNVDFRWWIPIGKMGHAFYMHNYSGSQEDVDKHPARIYDNSGKLVATTVAGNPSARYDGRVGWRMRIPDLPPGDYKVEMEMDAGPELGVLKGSRTMTVLRR